jgi:hypothetical protein
MTKAPEVSNKADWLDTIVKGEKEVPFPNKTNGEENMFIMRVLSLSETTAAQVEAQRATKKFLGEADESAGYIDLLNINRTIELLFRACRRLEDSSKPLFPSKEWMRDNLTADILSVLINNYMTVQVECGPIVGDMTTDEIEDWIKKLTQAGEGGAYFLDSFSLVAFKSLVLFMANQSVNYQMHKCSSTGLQQEDEETFNQEQLETNQAQESKNQA